MNRTQRAIQSIPAYPAEQFLVEMGANMGDSLGVLEDLILDDIYQLLPPAQPQRLGISSGPDGSYRTSSDTELGTPGAELHLDCAISLMPASGSNIDALIMVEVDDEGLISGIFLLPMAPLVPETSYSLVRADRECAREKLAQMTFVAFSRGTRITLATGQQKPIEDLRPGERILTRDDGVQELRWIGHSTSRAVGRMAPVLIKKGAMNNSGDLLVSPDHRLFVYQRRDELGTGCPELLVRARDLVNGETVLLQDGGFVDYFQLLFDRHHIIYAEGIAAESLYLDPMIQPALPDEVLQKITEMPATRQRRDSHGLDVEKSLLDLPNAVDLLKRSSLR